MQLLYNSQPSINICWLQKVQKLVDYLLGFVCFTKIIAWSIEQHLLSTLQVYHVKYWNGFRSLNTATSRKMEWLGKSGATTNCFALLQDRINCSHWNVNKKEKCRNDTHISHYGCHVLDLVGPSISFWRPSCFCLIYPVYETVACSFSTTI